MTTVWEVNRPETAGLFGEFASVSVEDNQGLPSNDEAADPSQAAMQPTLLCHQVIGASWLSLSRSFGYAAS